MDGPGGESMAHSSGGSTKSKEDEMLQRLENSIRIMSEHLTEDMTTEESEWGLQALRKLSMTLPDNNRMT